MPRGVGSGSKPAAEVKYYAAFNQKGEHIEVNSKICTQEIKTKCLYLNARNNDDGAVLQRAKEIESMVAEHIGKSPVIVNLVFGSKSGIEDDLGVIDTLQARYGDDFTKLMFCVDMCQLRSEVGLLQELMSKNVQVMITGSKFFQAPPFCGALLVPKSLAESVDQCKDASMASAYKEVFSAHDFINPTMKNIATQLETFENKGLRTRWEVALDEMEKYQAIPKASPLQPLRAGGKWSWDDWHRQ